MNVDKIVSVVYEIGGLSGWAWFVIGSLFFLVNAAIDALFDGSKVKFKMEGVKVETDSAAETTK